MLKKNKKQNCNYWPQLSQFKHIKHKNPSETSDDIIWANNNV